MDSCPVVPRANEPHPNLCMLYTAWFLMFKHWFCWKYQYKKYMFNFIDHLQFYFCGCTTLTGAYIADKTALTVRHSHFMNMYRLYVTGYRPILLMYVGCINWYLRNKPLFLWLKKPYFHFTDNGVYYPLLNIMVDTTHVLEQVSLQCLHCL